MLHSTSCCPPPLAKTGDIKTHLSACQSVRLSVTKNFKLAHIFWDIKERALVFGMHDPCDKPFLLVSCDDLGLHHWPTSRSTLLPGGDHNSLNLLVMFTLPAMKYSKTNQWQSSNLFKRNAPRKCTCHVGCGLIDVLNKRHYFIGRYQYMYTWDLVCYFQTIAVAMYYEVYDHKQRSVE